jgi:hypothetical protein
MLTTNALDVKRMKTTKTKERQNGIDNIEKSTTSSFGSHERLLLYTFRIVH